MLEFRYLLGSVAGLALTATVSTAVAAQEPPLTAPQRATAATRFEVSPGAVFLAREHNISPQEAARRMALMDRISRVVSQLQEGTDPEFAGVWLQHQPAFRLVVAFTNPNEAKLANLAIDSEIRSIIELRALPRSRRAVLAEQDRVIALLPQTIPYVSFVEDETARNRRSSGNSGSGAAGANSSIRARSPASLG